MNVNVNVNASRLDDTETRVARAIYGGGSGGGVQMKRIRICWC